MAAITCTTSEDNVLKTKENSQALPGFTVPELNAKQSSYLILYKSAPPVKSFLNLHVGPWNNDSIRASSIKSRSRIEMHLVPQETQGC